MGKLLKRLNSFLSLHIPHYLLCVFSTYRCDCMCALYTGTCETMMSELNISLIFSESLLNQGMKKKKEEDRYDEPQGTGSLFKKVFEY